MCFYLKKNSFVVELSKKGILQSDEGRFQDEKNLYF